MNDLTIYYYNKALDAALKYKDEGWITHIYNNVSIFYFNIRLLNEAEKLYRSGRPACTRQQ